jgi:GAF domain-containing protein
VARSTALTRAKAGLAAGTCAGGTKALGGASRLLAAYDDADVNFLQLVANHVAVSVEKVLAVQDIAAAFKEIQALKEQLANGPGAPRSSRRLAACGYGGTGNPDGHAGQRGARAHTCHAP